MVRTRLAAPRLALVAASLFVVVAGAIWLDTHFLPAGGAEDDGFQSQLVRAFIGLEDGDLNELAATSWLIFVHLGRLLAVGPFVLAEMALGPAGQLTLLMIAMAKLVTIPLSASGRALAFLPLAMPLVLSGRSVLVSAGVAYVALYLLSDRGRAWMLWLGALWCNLSSASVLIALLLLLFAKPRQPLARQQRVQRFAVLSLLAVSLAISAVDKIAGFEAGDLGYESQGSGADGWLLTAISRGTLLVSLAEGQSARAAVYATLILLMLVKLVTLLRDPKAMGMRRLLLCCVPGIFLEGLGVVALVFPLVWMFAGFDPSRRPTAIEKPA